MTKIIGNRKVNNTLDEMIEVSRERNAEVAEEERLERIRKAREEAESTKAPSGELTGNILKYDGLEWEMHAPRADIFVTSPKKLYSYHESLKRIKEANMERHPLPYERFSLLARRAVLEIMPWHAKYLADEMENITAEWLSMASLRREDVLTCYLHPEIIFSEGVPFVSCTSEKIEFNIKGKESGKPIDLSEFDDEFVKFMYGRSFKDLPGVMREGPLRAQVCLPDAYYTETAKLTVSYKYYLDINVERTFHSASCMAASRGVRKLKIMVDSNANGGSQ